MILRIDCPICKKDSYSASVVDFRPCPYCGIAFSGKYGIEKRNGARIKKEILFVLDHGGYKSDASTVDFSESGLSIKISDKISLPVGDVISFKLKNADIKAQVRWVNNKSDQPFTRAGFKIVGERSGIKT